MSRLLEALILVCTLAGAIIIGKLFQAEVLNSRRRNKPRYAPYLSIPGVLIVLAICLPVIVWIISS